MKYWTGVGARKTPIEFKEPMVALARKLDNLGYTLRSGYASGADTFFESGATKKEIYLPWPSFNGFKLIGDNYFPYIPFIILPKKIKRQCKEIAQSIHPNWNILTSGAKLMHARNVLQCLGQDLETPSKFLVCWTPSGAIVGGTATAIGVALKFGIPVFNLAKEKDLERIQKFIC